jgi:valyl-tRNA synthetase
MSANAGFLKWESVKKCNIINFMPEAMEPRYDHKAIEEKIYKLWEESGYFRPENLPAAQTNADRAQTNAEKSQRKSASSPRKSAFCIIMPPPNANGSLHIGHAVFVTLQDVLIRFWRMRGRKTLWLPGADHAGFETQVVFDKKLDKEGRNRFAMSREEVWKEMWGFTQKNKVVMENQLRRLGASCDWSREKFTLDPDIIKGTEETFAKMYEDGLVYRDIKIINWCPKHKTALSDLEVKYIEREDPLYYIKYGPLTLATVRPETKFGDTALAVNPKDARYKKYVGKEIEAVGILGPLKFKVIADDAVDPKFGTGVIKVTPAHDATDFEIWQRHKNEIAGPFDSAQGKPKIIIDENGRLTGDVGEFKGLKVQEAREKVAEKMKEIGILEKIDPSYKHQIATCYKCGTTLEPMPKPQWFVKMKPLAKKAIDVVKAGKIKFYPDRSKKVYFHWLKNIRDWNISRQIVWGIRIPAWFRNNEIYVGMEKPAGDGWRQDPDVFDTWFSSGQWPYLALGFKESSRVKSEKFPPEADPPSAEKVKSDFEEFYPTDVMETAYDILFFWVARMIMFGLYRTGKIPFKTVYLHGLVRDKDRQKMSKSKGNVIDPLGIADTYGTDAVRMALVAGNTAGNDIVISEDKIRGYRNFATKIWNVARFILMDKTADRRGTRHELTRKLTADDKKHLKELQKIKSQITKHLENFEFHLAAEKIYHYLWHNFADKIVESYKPRLQSNDATERNAAHQTLETIFAECLKMLHPFMPFITEEIYRKFMPGKLLMIEEW